MKEMIDIIFLFDVVATVTIIFVFCVLEGFESLPIIISRKSATGTVYISLRVFECTQPIK